MNFLKRGSCIIFVLIYIAAAGTALSEDRRGQNTRAVDEIYESIRYAGPAFEWEAWDLTFQHEGMMVVSTLVKPKTSGKVPVVLVLNGFAGDRKEVMIPETTEYLWERVSRMLAEQGLATLRIDFRGSGDSDGTYDFTTFSTQISDAIAAIDYISHKLRKEVDYKSIGVLGFSQGGLVAASTASRDDRVDSVVLWSPVSHVPAVYERLLTRAGVKQGLALPEGGTITLGIYVDDVYVDWDVPLGKKFFHQIYQLAPLAEVNKNYRGPLMTICGLQDPIIWPQPHMSELYLTHHDGFEKMVVLDGDHAFNWWEGPNPEKLHDAIMWSAAWFLYTLD
jgi:pimeloyl-ACP methyl ester carboxylesterase